MMILKILCILVITLCALTLLRDSKNKQSDANWAKLESLAKSFDVESEKELRHFLEIVNDIPHPPPKEIRGMMIDGEVNILMYLSPANRRQFAIMAVEDAKKPGRSSAMRYLQARVKEKVMGNRK